MANEYLDNLVAELEQSGVMTPASQLSNTTQVNKNVNDIDLQAIMDIERITGTKFSDEQRAVLEHRGNACILACAGSGKTTTSVNLIAKRIMTGEIKDVNKMIYTTYSKAGATEMKERLDKLLAKLGINKAVQVRTLHAFFLSIIRTFGINSNIISAGERSRFIREACKEAEYLPKDDDLMLIDSLLSYQVNNLLTDKKTIESYVNTIDDLTVNTYAKIRSGYAKKKLEKGLIDYDDMQTYLWKWLTQDVKSEDPNVKAIGIAARDYCKAYFTDFYIDEAQDVSKIQFAIIRAIVTDPNDKNKLTAGLTFIGDDDQCLVEGTKVIAGDSLKNIEDILYGDKIKSCIGHGKSKFITVDNGSKKEIDDDIIVIRTKSGKEIKGTHNHIGFAKLVPRENEYYTYLMYRHDFGFRVGTTSGVRAGIRKGIVNGIEMRLMQERSDKIWVLKVCDSEKESKYWEAYFAYKYSIPMYRFVTSDTGKGIPDTSLDINDVKRLHKELNTFENGIKLLDDLRMSFKYPHRVPQAEGDRCRIGFSMFGSGQTNKYNIHKSEVSVNSSNQEYIDITSNYLATTNRTSRTKYNYFNSRMTTCDTDLELKAISNILDDCKEADIYVEPSYSAKLTTEKNFLFMPFCNMIKGMVVPVYNEDGSITEDEIISVTKEHYKGYVYDLSLTETRNFVANGIVVHNCIYTWRGSDPSIILTAGATFNMTVFKLTTNYRCYNEIVDFAANGVKHNNGRYEKDMHAHNQGGSVKITMEPNKDLCALSNVAMAQIKKWIADGNNPKDIAVLSRNNFHLAILSNMLLREGIYCNITEEMKLTKSFMYNDIKDLIAMSGPTWDSNLTQRLMWKLCRFLGGGNSKMIADFQNTCALSLQDALGYIVKHYIDDTIVFDKKLGITLQAEQKIEYCIKTKLTADTRQDIKYVYLAVTNEDRQAGLKTLMFMYEQGTKFLYKSADRSRSIKGLTNYVQQVIDKDGFDGALNFFRMTEQLESGSMVIPGQKITLTTVHSAKGREWKNVIMFACDNISFPSFDGIVSMLNDGISIHDINYSLSEERRLFYVGCTRAKENLLLITYPEPSIFILEALGITKENADTSNAKIIELAQQQDWVTVYKDEINSVILDPSSKYYFDKNTL